MEFKLDTQSQEVKFLSYSKSAMYGVLYGPSYYIALDAYYPAQVMSSGSGNRSFKDFSSLEPTEVFYVNLLQSSLPVKRY